MGIKNLNRFLYDNCTKKSIKKIHLSQLANKTVVIDTSIYLYKFSSDDSLMENMYLLISILKHHNIQPVFVFDGKPPPEKRELLQQRRIEKKDAEEKYTKLKGELEEGAEPTEKVKVEMDKLKRMFIKISDENIKKVKILMDAYGVTHYDAPGEADHLCAFLVKNNSAWGCISDDMDMFLYGCNFVIRNISLLKHTAVLYDTSQIWKDLEMSEQTFREIMVLSGTDYNIHSKTSLKETIRWYYEYIKYQNKNKEKSLGFYLWLVKNTKYVEDYKLLLNVYKLFICNNCCEFEEWRCLKIDAKPVDDIRLRKVMEPEGFVFSV
jgi:hypothetical protein